MVSSSHTSKICNTVCRIRKKKLRHTNHIFTIKSQLSKYCNLLIKKRAEHWAQDLKSCSLVEFSTYPSIFLATTKVIINPHTNNFLNTNLKTKTPTHFKTQIQTPKSTIYKALHIYSWEINTPPLNTRIHCTQTNLILWVLALYSYVIRGIPQLFITYTTKTLHLSTIRTH